MFELPEYMTLAQQMNDTIQGKVIRRGQLGNSPHKFVWYNRSHEEFEELTRGKKIGEAKVKGRWLFLPLGPGFTLLLGECGGKILYHPAGSMHPKKYHLSLTFEDDSFFTVTTQMWGAMELYDQGEEINREYIKGMRITPVESEFTFEYFDGLLNEQIAAGKRSAKSLLTQDQLIPGLGNAIAQDILFRAHLHPRHPLNELTQDHRHGLYQSILDTIQEVIESGGRYDEFDLYNRTGGYIRLMDKNALKRSCPECGGRIEKMQYLGGTCYFCSSCQI